MQTLNDIKKLVFSTRNTINVTSSHLNSNTFLFSTHSFRSRIFWHSLSVDWYLHIIGYKYQLQTLPYVPMLANTLWRNSYYFVVVEINKLYRLFDLCIRHKHRLLAQLTDPDNVYTMRHKHPNSRQVRNFMSKRETKNAKFLNKIRSPFSQWH